MGRRSVLPPYMEGFSAKFTVRQMRGLRELVARGFFPSVQEAVRYAVQRLLEEMRPLLEETPAISYEDLALDGQWLMLGWA